MVRTRCCVSMLKSATRLPANAATMWAGSLLTASTEVGGPSSDKHHKGRSTPRFRSNLGIR